MAYKFQVGGARMSGSLIQEGDLEVYDHSGASKAKISLAGALTAASMSGSGVLQVGGAATFAAAVSPLADAAADLGASGKQWKDLYVHGIGYIDQIGTDADPVAGYFNAGEIDGVAIGSESPSTAVFTSMSGTTLGATAVTANSLDLQGGTATVGGLTAEANLDIGAFTFRATQFVSDIATGTAPLSVSSTTKVDNLNADKLDGADWAAPAALGSTTPAVVSGSNFSGSGVLQIGSNSLWGGDLVPARDSAIDLGSSAKQFAEAHIDHGYIDAITATGTSTLTTVDINGGNIDATAIGAATQAAAQFTTISGSGGLQVGGVTFVSADIRPTIDSTNNLGTSALRFSTIYVDNIVGADVAKDVEKVAAGGSIAAGTDFALITSANGGTVTLPGASAGKTLFVKLSGGVGNLVLAAAGGDTVEAAASILLESTGSAVTLISYDALAWFVL
mgnify:CR=1 FL=1|tara:strand:+ start:4858 stop:6201 length:1344 start_codon:yes stop_codon:yes gene_type:complete